MDIFHTSINVKGFTRTEASKTIFTLMDESQKAACVKVRRGPC